MEIPQPASPPAKSKLPIIIVILALLGPSVGNVFSNIIQNLPTPTP